MTLGDEVTVGGNKYRLGKLSVRQQWNIVRRLAPLLKGFGAMIQNLGGIGDISDALGRPESMEAATPFAEALAKLSDADSDYVMNICLGVCQRLSKVGEQTLWAKVVTPTGDLMFEDVTMPVMLQLVWGVLNGNLAGFFPGAAARPSAT